MFQSSYFFQLFCFSFSLSEHEKATTFRLISKRNTERRAALEEAERMKAAHEAAFGANSAASSSQPGLLPPESSSSVSDANSDSKQEL